MSRFKRTATASRAVTAERRCAAAATPGQTYGELRELQRLAGTAIFRPLTPGWKMRPRWSDGSSTREVVAGFIKPNDRLTSFERLELYNRQYWFRVLDSLYDDFPGVRAVVGDRAFTRLSKAYMVEYPSRTHTLRNLGSNLARFIEESRSAGSKTGLAVEVARFEWAEIVAFDGPAIQPVSADDLLGRDPSKLRLRLQPYVTLMELEHDVDEFLLALRKRTDERGDASQAVAMKEHTSRERGGRMPKREKVFVAVHRVDHSVYYKRLEPVAYRLLTALRDGKTLGRACAVSLENPADLEVPSPRPSPTPGKGRGGQRVEGADRDWAAQLQAWFKSWTGMGWFGLYSSKAKGEER